MEILFQSSYVQDRELAKEYFRFQYWQRKMLVIVHIYLVIGWVINVVSLFLEGGDSTFFLFFVPGFLLVQWINYLLSIRKIVKRNADLTNGALEIETVVTDTYVESTNSLGTKVTLTLDDLKNYDQTKNLILVRTKAGTTFIFRKDSFTHGTAEEFIDFLHSNGVNKAKW